MDPLSSEFCSSLPQNVSCTSSRFDEGYLFEIFLHSGSNASLNALKPYQSCESYVLFPGENTWPRYVRGILYMAALLYCFVGFAAITTFFMTAMETIVQKTRKVVMGDGEVREARVWNPAVADITLLALGTCAPQIALAMIDAVQLLGKDQSEALGAGTILGGAAFNVFPILGTIVLVPLRYRSVRKIEKYGVFWVEMIWSIWAFLWVLIILQWSTPGKVSLWEAIITVLQMPLVVLHAYFTYQGWFDWGKTEKGRGVRPPGFALYRSYFLKASTALTAEKRPLGHSGEEVSRKLRKRLLMGLKKKLSFGALGHSMENLRNFGGKLRKMRDIVEGTEEEEGEKVGEMGGNSRGNLERTLSVGKGGIKGENLENLHRRKSVSDEVGKGGIFQEIVEVSDVSEDEMEEELESCAEELGDSGEEKKRGNEGKTWGEIFQLWRLQIVDAMSVKGSVDDNGVDQLPGIVDFVMHPIAFFWKVLFSLVVPPSPLGGGWPAFCTSIFFIMGIAAIVIELANLFGCVSGANSFVVAITILASGTSFPDLIASYIAADHEASADSAVANINASNCITVFLGLGCPWLMGVIYNKVKLGKDFETPVGDLGFTLGVYFGVFLVAMVILTLRRKFIGGELGGKRIWAILSSVAFFALWVIFLLLVSLKAYAII